ncbi:hypothetical protein A8C32_03950 [Flavivirga aquatica]|uniref:Uncharacterized protein n=1 Tax=Flavivirga aquatica TaxID=1849968 RepID=A0A1E5TB76_9FLAO|nr:hypothetical protein [Flavivirga aquatica]OEK08611.1 hypothetical protein A8C32_03950 [Flavivirga aquatica]
MNKIFKVLFYWFLIFTMFNCSSTRENVIINQYKTNYNIIIKSAKDNKRDIINIQFPNKVVIKNNSFYEKSFNQIRYIYENIPIGRDYRIGLFQEIENNLKKISNSSKKSILSKKNQSFIIYTRHFLDSTKTTQQQFKPYIKRMLAENKDTLHIGTVKEFKIKHKELFEKLTNNDSISIQFLDDGKLGERITVPVKW